MSAVTIASWLLTYLVHSTVLLGAAWLVSRHLGDRRLALQETLLRTALIGGLLTTTLQIGFGVEPVGGALAIADFSQPEVVAAGGNATTSVVAGDSLFSATPTIHSQTLDSWPVALLSLWGLGSLLAMLVLGPRPQTAPEDTSFSSRGAAPRPPGRRYGSAKVSSAEHVCRHRGAVCHGNPASGDLLPGACC